MGLSLSAQAQISPLKIDHSQNKTKDKYIKSAHEVITHQLTLDEVRFSILNAALTSSNVKWLLEESGDNFILLRWDYSGAVIYTRVEFDEHFIQLKYAGSFDDYECKNNIDGICYRNGKVYYSRMKKLRTEILNTVNNYN